MLVARQLDVRLGAAHIVRDVSLEAEPGTFTAVIGPNGSGKTTLLRALTGEVPFSGSATLGDLDIARASPQALAARRGVLPQATSLSFPFTVHEVVRLGLSMGVHDPARDGQRVAEALAAVDLADFGGRFYQELSGGEAQRVQLARVLAQVWEPVFEGRPRCLFLDEPISSLDIRHQIQILELAARYADAGGMVLAVLHDLNLTAQFADQVILLDRGRVHAAGTPRAVLTPSHLEAVYGCPMSVGAVPPGQDFFVLPHIPRRRRSAAA